MSYWGRHQQEAARKYPYDPEDPYRFLLLWEEAEERDNMEWNDIKYKQTAEDIQEVTSEIRDLLISKNESYGDSALNPKRIFSRADLLEQLNVRLDDKLSRLAYGRGDLIPEDVELDILGYLILRRIARKRARLADQQALEKAPIVNTPAGPGRVVDSIHPDENHSSRREYGPGTAAALEHKRNTGDGSSVEANRRKRDLPLTEKPESTRESYGEHH